MRRPGKEVYKPESEIDINQAYFREFAKVVSLHISNGTSIEMPTIFGTLTIVGNNHRKVNRKRSSELGKIVYFKNLDTNGLGFKARVMLNLRRHSLVSIPLLFHGLVFRPYSHLNRAIFNSTKNGSWKKWRVFN